MSRWGYFQKHKKILQTPSFWGDVIIDVSLFLSSTTTLRIYSQICGSGMSRQSRRGEMLHQRRAGAVQGQPQNSCRRKAAMESLNPTQFICKHQKNPTHCISASVKIWLQLISGHPHYAILTRLSAISDRSYFTVLHSSGKTTGIHNRFCESLAKIICNAAFIGIIGVLKCSVILKSVVVKIPNRFI